MADIGLIGTGIMGGNLAINMSNKGFKVSCWNKTLSKAISLAKHDGINAFTDIPSLIDSLSSPKKLLLMVDAQAVDQIIELILPYIKSGDVIIDGGNSNFEDTNCRSKCLSANKIFFFSAGISGGKLGAYYGPAIMIGGPIDGWPLISHIMETIAAKHDGKACCQLVGMACTGHFVKIMHNALEYVDMQLLCEAYDFMRKGFGMSNSQIAGVFNTWNEGRLKGYLTNAVAQIVNFKDHPLDKLIDVVHNKGTGLWAVNYANRHGIPLTIVSAALSARQLSMLRELRQCISSKYAYIQKDTVFDIEMWEHAVYAARVLAYSQVYHMMTKYAEIIGWDIDLQRITSIWQNGSIISSQLLTIMKNAGHMPLLHEDIINIINNSMPMSRKALIEAITLGIPMPALSAAISWYDTMASDKLPANLAQALRDYFGAHGCKMANESISIPWHE